MMPTAEAGGRAFLVSNPAPRGACTLAAPALANFWGPDGAGTPPPPCGGPKSPGKTTVQGWGKIGLRPRGVADVHFPTPRPLLARRDGAMTTGIHSPPVPPLPPTVVVFMSGLFRLHPIARGGGGMQRPTMASRWQISLMQMSRGLSGASCFGEGVESRGEGF